MQTLAERLAEPDVADLPDWQAAAILNAPDPTLPAVVTWEPTEVGVGSIMDVLGPVDGAGLLDFLQASQSAVVRWGLHLIMQGRLDISRESTRAQIDGLAQAGALTASQREALLAISKRERFPSWAEFNGISVDARAVGLARGGKP